MQQFQNKNPFVGLRAFEEREDYLFFGRNKEIDDLIRKFSGNRFLAVIGSSGSGKSSLVKSGMLPQIYGGFMKAGGNWRVALMQPGENPIGYLARQLAQEGVLYYDIRDSELPYELIIESRLRRSENGLQLAYSDAHLPERENLLIVVDQFEELFRFSKYEKENHLGQSDAIHFIQVLLSATAQTQYPIYVLLTMRSDFLGDCSEFRGLPEAINKGQYLVPRMTRDEIREAITGPVAVSGASISPRLVTRLLNDINNDPDQLPILQHAMMRTWNAWYERAKPESPIDFEDYDQIGTMASALSQHADEAYAELSTANEQKACELMFKALTDTSADTRGIRRPKSLTDLCILTGSSQAEIKKLIEVFRKPGRTFLMPPSGILLRDDTIIDISHESLMRVWKRLVTWTEEEARSGDQYLRLANSAQLHDKGQRGYLKDPELGIALKWKELNHPTAKWAESFKADFEKTMAYLDESQVKDLEEKQLIARKEAVRKRQRKAIYALLGALVIVGAVVSLYMTNAKARAVEMQKRADSLKNEAVTAKDQAIRANIEADRQKDTAIIARDSARSAQQKAVESELRAKQSAVEAELQRDSAEAQRNKAEQLKKQALINTYKNAPSEYARLIREGPTNMQDILQENFDDKLPAYAAHLEMLGRKTDSFAPEARGNYDNIVDRLYYNNDLYQKVYACMKTIPGSGGTLFREGLTNRPSDGKFKGDPDPDDPIFSRINTEVRSQGKSIIRIIENKKSGRILCSTNDNRILVFNTNTEPLKLENSIPMGALVTALDYNDEKSIIYFGLKTGNIGYIQYSKERKRYQPILENYLGSPIVALDLFQSAIKGKSSWFLLVAAEKSTVRVYKLDENSLHPDKNLFGNSLPETNLGLLTGARFDPKTKNIEIRAKSQKSSAPLYSLWNPFAALALEKYKSSKKNWESYLEQTRIY